MPITTSVAKRKRVGLPSGRVKDLVALTKPRVMSLAVFTAMVGMVMAPGRLHPLAATAAILAIAIGAGAAGVLNMWYDAGIDATMARTSHRPIPAGRVTPTAALIFGLLLTILSLLLLAMATNPVATIMLGFTIFFYAVIYTMWLKHRTPQNIVIGGAAGALPPVIGWAAVTGSVGLDPVILFLIIFLWTPPHFWALALLRMRDYAAAGIPMMPVVAGVVSTKRQIFGYTLLLVPASLLPWATQISSMVYAVVAVPLGAVFVHKAWSVLQSEEAATASARALFAYSIFYLFAIYSALLLDAVAWRIISVPG